MEVDFVSGVIGITKTGIANNACGICLTGTTIPGNIATLEHVSAGTGSLGCLILFQHLLEQLRGCR